MFGDEIAIRAQTLVHDAANPAEVMRDVMAYATAGHSPDERDQIVKMIQETAREWAVYNFSSGCEVADMLAQRLDFGPTCASRCGSRSSAGTATATPTTPGRRDSAADANRARQPRHGGDRPSVLARSRPGGCSRPPRQHLRPRAGRPVRRSRRSWFDRLAETEPWDAVLALEPEPHRVLLGVELDDALTVVADFIDLKSPYMGGHSRRCARVAADAGQVLGLDDDAADALRRSALVHDFGTTVVPNSIWDKPGPLTRAEFDRVELHPMVTEQMLRRSPALAVLNPVASAHHEKCDGSGYHKRLRADDEDLGACVLAATEVYVGLTTERADRPRFDAGRRGQRASPAGVGGRARAARQPGGAGGRRPRRAADVARQAPAESRRADPPRGRGAAACGEGPDHPEIADRLYISPKTADHHIQHIYGKIGVSTRAAAALWAMQHAIVQ